MDFLTILFIALGLAMDAFAVSVTSGVTIKRLDFKNSLKIALSFGIFQSIMPVVGWLAGVSLQKFIEDYDHWVALALLSFVGIKMIYESFTMREEEKYVESMSSQMLLMLSIATSIDALVVGMTFAFLDVAIVLPVIIIGLVTFLLSLAGIFLGKKFGNLFQSKIEIAGGLILIIIGIKIVLDHIS
jgi:manganese efflux pump family protein